MIGSAITKACSVCGQTKPTSDFYRHPSTRDGLDRKCKDCRKSASRKWKAENCGRARETDRRWRQQNRERANAHYRRWRQKNKEKHLKLCREWNAANRERCRANFERWKDMHPGRLAEWHRQRRARLRVGQSYSEAEWHALLAIFGYRCAACGVDARATREGFLTPDHVIPVCMGGPNTIDNIQPLCLDCNRRKNGRFIDYRPDWAR
jgi:hypothetical protein